MKDPTPISGISPESLMALEKNLEFYAGPDRIISSTELRAEIGEAKIQRKHQTGLAHLDEAIGLIENGELIAIGGPTKNGKTLLAQTMTVNMAATGTSCLWFTFEVPPRQFLSQLPPDCLFYLPRELKRASMHWLQDRVFEGKIKHDARVVFIDNLHHLLDFTTVRNVSLDIGVIIRALKRMAVDLNVAVVVLCHSRKSEMKDGRPVEVSEWDLRDSSFIPQECDATIMVQRKMNKETQEVTNGAIIKVCLHRRMGTMGRKIHVVKTGEVLEEDVRFYEV